MDGKNLVGKNAENPDIVELAHTERRKLESDCSVLRIGLVDWFYCQRDNDKYSGRLSQPDTLSKVYTFQP